MAHKTGVLGSYWSQCEGGLSRQKCVHFSARFLCLQPSHRKVKICYGTISALSITLLFWSAISDVSKVVKNAVLCGQLLKMFGLFIELLVCVSVHLANSED